MLGLECLHALDLITRVVIVVKREIRHGHFRQRFLLITVLDNHRVGLVDFHFTHQCAQLGNVADRVNHREIHPARTVFVGCQQPLQLGVQFRILGLLKT